MAHDGNSRILLVCNLYILPLCCGGGIHWKLNLNISHQSLVLWPNIEVSIMDNSSFSKTLHLILLH